MPSQLYQIKCEDLHKAVDGYFSEFAIPLLKALEEEPKTISEKLNEYLEDFAKSSLRFRILSECALVDLPT